MKNKALPLAAALLAAAVSAPAQTFSLGSLTSPTGTNSFSMTAGASDPDWIFKCSTPPYKACTPDEEKRRDFIKSNGVCPAPVSKACTAYVMQNSNQADQFLAIHNNPAMQNEEFFKKCGTIPYRACTADEEKQRTEWLKQGKPNDDGVCAVPPGGVNFGSLGDLGGNTPQPFKDDESYQAALKDQRQAFPDQKIVELPNRTFAVDTGGGKYSISGVCSGGPCSGMPQIPNQMITVALMKQDAQAKQQDTPKMGANAIGSDTVQQAPAGRAPKIGDGGSGDGAEVVASQNQVNGGGGSPRSGTPPLTGSGVTGGGSYSGGSVTAKGDGRSDANNDIAIDGNTVTADGEITYIKLQEHQQKIRADEKTFVNGGMTGFAAPNAPTPGTVGDPPVDPKYLGKIQAAANDGSAK